MRRGAIMCAVLAAATLACASVAAAQTAPRSGDAGRGAALYTQRCSACHSIDANRIGPAHRGVVGRHAARAEGFAYSAALRRLDVVWTRENLQRWLAGPPAMAPGTSMGINVPDAQDRADIIAYLETQRAPR